MKMRNRLLCIVTLLFFTLSIWTCAPKFGTRDVLVQKNRSFRKKYLSGAIMDSIYIRLWDKSRVNNYYDDPLRWPKDLTDTLEVFAGSTLLYRGTLHDLYFPYCGTRYADLCYRNTKREKITTFKIINTGLHKEKSAVLLLTEVYSENNMPFTVKSFGLSNLDNWEETNIYMIDPYDSEDNRYLFKYFKKDK